MVYRTSLGKEVVVEVEVVEKYITVMLVMITIMTIMCFLNLLINSKLDHASRDNHEIW